MDGLTRYDIDFLEDVNWVKHILLSMKAISINKDGLVVNKNESGEIRSKTPMCFESRRTYEYDFSKLPNPDTNVVMHVRVKNLDLSEEERHKLRVIATPNYDADSDVIKLTSDYNFKLGEGVENPLNKMANKVILARALSDLISDSKVNPHEFTDIPTGVGDSLAAPVPPKKPRHKKKLARQQRLVLLKCRTKQKFEYVMNRRKHNFIL